MQLFTIKIEDKEFGIDWIHNPNNTSEITIKLMNDDIILETYECYSSNTNPHDAESAYDAEITYNTIRDTLKHVKRILESK